MPEKILTIFKSVVAIIMATALMSILLALLTGIRVQDVFTLLAFAEFILVWCYHDKQQDKKTAIAKQAEQIAQAIHEISYQALCDGHWGSQLMKIRRMEDIPFSYQHIPENSCLIVQQSVPTATRAPLEPAQREIIQAAIYADFCYMLQNRFNLDGSRISVHPPYTSNGYEVVVVEVQL